MTDINYKKECDSVERKKPKRVAFKSLGCKVNQYETGTLKKAFSQNGYQIAEFKEKADIYIINTCAVTQEAERKSRQMVRKAARSNPFATIIVTGCALQSSLDSMQRECEQANLFIGNYYKNAIFSIIDQRLSKAKANRQKLILFRPASHIKSYSESAYHSMSRRIRGFVKIQDGCDQFCSYCVIPYLRGRPRSRSPQKILSEVNFLASNGHKEIVLLGINLGSYGEDMPGGNINNLLGLIQEIEKIPQIDRIRLSSIELNWITKDLIALFSHSNKLCHHLHIPLQSGDDKILSLMRRNYHLEEFEMIVKNIRNSLPDIAITTDLIVGFPGEDDLSFDRTFQFIHKISFAKLHIFPYSERPLTLSSFLPNQVTTDLIKNRTQKFIMLSEKFRKAFFQKNIGQERDVLVEYQTYTKNQIQSYGLTDNYIKVRIDDFPLKSGEVIKVRLKEAEGQYIKGEPIPG